MVQRITDQLNGVLFPIVVDSSTVQRLDRLQRILLQGTRLSLAMVVASATVLGLTARPLVMLWVGPEFSGSVTVIYILCFVVAVRVGNATSAVILKGSERHRLLAIANVVMAAANLGLSVLLVRRYGLVGVAIGTLIPIVLVSGLVVFPAACRRVNISITTVIRESVWPATWPALIVSVFVVMTRGWIRNSWAILFLQSFLAAAAYTGLFFRFAIKRNEREWYFLKVKEVLQRHSISDPSNVPGRAS
jgi:O-antigen/teichoic acid export membrane protein